MSEDLNSSVSENNVERVEFKKEDAAELSNMSNKDIKWRARYKEAVSELETLKASEDRKNKEISEKFSAIEKERNDAIQKRVDAEIKAAAVNAGLTDLDLIKLIDKDKISIDQSGDPVGIDDLINEFKELKPAYFSEAKKTSSSANSEFIKNVPPVRKSAFDMTDDEFKAEMRKMGA